MDVEQNLALGSQGLAASGEPEAAQGRAGANECCAKHLAASCIEHFISPSGSCSGSCSGSAADSASVLRKLPRVEGGGVVMRKPDVLQFMGRQLAQSVDCATGGPPNAPGGAQAAD